MLSLDNLFAKEGFEALRKVDHQRGKTGAW